MTNELAVRAQDVNITELQTTARLLAMSNYFDAKGNSDVAIAQMATKILAGRELGYGPFASVNGIRIIQGRPAISANLMASAVKASVRYDYRVKVMSADVVTIEFYERTQDGKRELLGESTFTKEDAKNAGTQNMAKFARNMLFARAMSNGVRFYCPDVFSGNAVYVPEELGATVDGEGNVIDVQVKEAQPQQTNVQPPVTGVVQDKPVSSSNGNGNGNGNGGARLADATTLKHLHACGGSLYGGGWDDKRHELVKRITKGRTESSKELTQAEADKLIDGIEAKLQAELAAVTVEDAVEVPA